MLKGPAEVLIGVVAGGLLGVVCGCTRHLWDTTAKCCMAVCVSGAHGGRRRVRAAARRCPDTIPDARARPCARAARAVLMLASIFQHKLLGLPIAGAIGAPLAAQTRGGRGQRCPPDRHHARCSCAQRRPPPRPSRCRAGALMIGLVAPLMWDRGWPKWVSAGPERRHAHAVSRAAALLWAWVFEPLLFVTMASDTVFAQVEGPLIASAMALMMAGACPRLLGVASRRLRVCAPMAKA